MIENKVIIALDLSDLEKMRKVVGELSPHTGFFKVGLEMFIRFGPEIVREVVEQKGHVMLDLKLHDIPTTVKKATKNAASLGAELLTIHASGGGEMMKAARSGVEEFEQETGKKGPKLLGVTVLTSIDQETLNKELGVEKQVDDQVVALAKLAQSSGLDGVVSSPKEIEKIRTACGENFLIVTPGIRPAGASKDDQKRICTPAEAIKKGASYLVIGRPVLKAENPVDAIVKINGEIGNLKFEI